MRSSIHTSAARATQTPRGAAKGNPGLRRLLFGVACVGGVIASFAANDSADVAAVLPYMLGVLILQFAPMFWPERPDAFAPVALPALLFGPDLLAHLLEMLDTENIDFVYLTGLSAATRVDLLQKVLVLLILCNIFYFIGYYSGLGRQQIARIFPDVRNLQWRKYRVALVCLVCMGAFTAAYAFFQSRVSAPITDFTALKEGKAVWRDDPTMSWLGRGILLGCIPPLLWVAHTARKPKRSRVLMVAFVCVLMALLTTRLGQRGHALNFALTCLIVVHYVYRRVSITTLAGLAFAALVALNVTGEWRQREEGATTPQVSVAGRVMAPRETLSAYSNDRNRIPILATVMYYFPERQDWLMGDSYVALLAAPIPKWVWPEKDVIFRWRDTGIVGYLHDIPGPVQMQGVLYANFAWIGAAVGMFLWGMFQRGMYDWLLKARDDPSRALLYATMVLYVAPSNLALAMALQYVLPIGLILWFIGVRRASPGEASDAEAPPALAARTVEAPATGR
jgi:hypothetical protein